jgi:hypothetical protein
MTGEAPVSCFCVADFEELFFRPAGCFCFLLACLAMVFS